MVLLMFWASQQLFFLHACSKLVKSSRRALNVSIFLRISFASFFQNHRKSKLKLFLRQLKFLFIVFFKITRFRKWTFVRDENTQRHHTPCLIQLFILNENIFFILKFKQRFMSYFKYFKFSWIYYLIFFVYSPLSQISSRITQPLVRLKTKTSH